MNAYHDGGLLFIGDVHGCQGDGEYCGVADEARASVTLRVTSHAGPRLPAPRVETAEEVRDRILEAARFIDPACLGSTDDCGFAPFSDDMSTSRDTAFAKIRARIEGNAMASKALAVG